MDNGVSFPLATTFGLAPFFNKYSTVSVLLG